MSHYRENGKNTNIIKGINVSLDGNVVYGNMLQPLGVESNISYTVT